MTGHASVDSSTQGRAPGAEVGPAELNMTLSDALERAQADLREGRFDAAESIFVQILDQMPDEPNALHFFGLLRHQQGRTAEAIPYLRRTTQLVPEAPGPWMNLGNVLIETEQFIEALIPLQRAQRLDPESPTNYNNLGIAYLHADQLEASEAAFREGLRLDPKRHELHHNFARMLKAGGRLPEAVASLNRSIELQPDIAASHQLLSICHFELGDTALSLAALQKWQTLDPENPKIDHLRAGILGKETPLRASDDYVRDEFDKFAESFDHKLDLLEYRAPALVTQALTAIVSALPDAPAILDAGCGTGLCAPLIKPFCGRLVGVDLSQGMLQQAEKRRLYDCLERAELTEYLEKSPATFDAVISADTLCYFGDLAGFLIAAHRSLRGFGVVIFTLESLVDRSADFHLQIHGRYSHSREYVLRVVRENGFSVAGLTCKTLRKETDKDVAGFLVTAVRIPGAESSN
ncbi:MAG: tetratricopeptide repeat protein [Ideonella sp.]